MPSKSCRVGIWRKTTAPMMVADAGSRVSMNARRAAGVCDAVAEDDVNNKQRTIHERRTDAANANENEYGTARSPVAKLPSLM
jgi:hypothetical protein